MKELKTEQDVIDYVNTLTPDEAREVLRELEASLALRRALREEGVAVVVPPRERQQDSKH